MIRKYNVIYNKEGIAVDKVEVPNTVILKTQKSRELANKIVPGFVKPEHIKVPKPVGQGRTERVIEECKGLKIKDPVIIERMLRAVYGTTKSEKYIRHRLDHALHMLGLRK